jgi:hypothetical protein
MISRIRLGFSDIESGEGNSAGSEGFVLCGVVDDWKLLFMFCRLFKRCFDELEKAGYDTRELRACLFGISC